MVGEDWDLCERVRAVGFRIYADTTVALGHLTASTLMPVYGRTSCPAKAGEGGRTPPSPEGWS